MDFRAYIKNQIVPGQHGMEIGPSYSPILPKSLGYDVLSLDHANQKELQEKYRNDPSVDIARIEHVDILDTGCEFKPFSRNCRGFDYIVSSHNFEHMTDPVHFLQRAERALKPDGRLFLLIPDKRRCFDYFRPVSTSGQLLEAYKRHSLRHTPAVMYDHVANAATQDGNIAWGEAASGNFQFMHSPEQAFAAAMQETEEYRDAHAWTFTSASFQLILHDLHALNLLTMGIAYSHESIGCEFFIVLSPSVPKISLSRLELAQRALDENPAPAQSIASASPTVLQITEHNAYEANAPSAQNAVDLFKGLWASTFPTECNLSAGSIPLFDDPRVHWLIGKMGSVSGLDLLELGPLEAGHTSMLLKAGARSVLAIEANKAAYLRCLVAKENVGLANASFLLGNFVPFLEQDPRRWPLIVASGVLYHMADPLHVLELLARKADILFLWTHYIDNAVMPADDPRRTPLGKEETHSWKGTSITLYPRPYGVNRLPHFCGGITDPKWMEKKSLFSALRTLGYTSIETAFEDTANQFGPSTCIFARKA